MLLQALRYILRQLDVDAFLLMVLKTSISLSPLFEMLKYPSYAVANADHNSNPSPTINITTADVTQPHTSIYIRTCLITFCCFTDENCCSWELRKERNDSVNNDTLLITALLVVGSGKLTLEYSVWSEGLPLLSDTSSDDVELALCFWWLCSWWGMCLGCVSISVLLSRNVKFEGFLIGDIGNSKSSCLLGNKLDLSPSTTLTGCFRKPFKKIFKFQRQYFRVAEPFSPW